MSLQVVSTNPMAANEGRIECQMCSNAGTDIFVCNNCFSFCCTPCSNAHICIGHSEKGEFAYKFERIQTKPVRNLELRKKKSQERKGKTCDSSETKKQLVKNCQRCFVLSASKECSKCKIKYYCEHCFRNIHNCMKLSSQKEEKSHKQENKQAKGKLKRPSIGISINLQPQTHSLTPGERESVISALQMNLNFIKSTLELEQHNHENEINQSINGISKHFTDLIEDIKLKMYKLITQMREISLNNLSIYQMLNKTVREEERNLVNLKTITKQESNYLVSSNIINLKIERCEKIISDTASSEQFNNLRDPIDKFCLEIAEDIEEIKSNVNRIQLKRHYDNSKISSNNSNPSSQKHHPLPKVESKTLNTFFNVSSLKSIEKNTHIPFNLTSPKKGELKTHKDLINSSSKVYFIEPNSMNSPQEEKQASSKKCITLQTCREQNTSMKCIQKSKDRTIPASMMSPKASMKKFDKNIQNFSKSNILKAGANIEKTKNMIKQIRKEMIHFTSRYNSDKELSQGSQPELMLQSANISQLSLESLTGRTDKQ